MSHKFQKFWINGIIYINRIKIKNKENNINKLNYRNGMNRKMKRMFLKLASQKELRKIIIKNMSVKDLITLKRF